MLPSIRQNELILLRKEKLAYFKKLNPSNAKQFWKVIKNVNEKESSILHFIIMEPLHLQTWRKLLLCLTISFTTCFNSSLEPFHQDDLQNDNILLLSTCPPELLCILRRRSLHSSKHWMHQKQVAQMVFPLECSRVLLHLTNNAVQHLYYKWSFPNCWKQSSVVSIPKASAHDCPTNYRPISLLSVAIDFIGTQPPFADPFSQRFVDCLQWKREPPAVLLAVENSTADI